MLSTEDSKVNMVIAIYWRQQSKYGDCYLLKTASKYGGSYGDCYLLKTAMWIWWLLSTEDSKVNMVVHVVIAISTEDSINSQRQDHASDLDINFYDLYSADDSTLMGFL